MTQSGRGLLASILLSAALTGCAGNGAVDTSVLTAGTTGALAALPDAAASIAKGMQQPVGSPTDIYTRIARGMLTCWLGGYGRLRSRYMFQAEAQPEHMGGVSTVSIHERVPNSPNQPGRITFQVTIQPFGETATVSAENRHMPPTIADNLSQDVYRWAAGEEGCLEAGVTSGWGAIPSATGEGPQARKR